MNQKQRHFNKLIKKFIKKGLKYNYQKSNFEKAIQMFDKAIELNPNNANAYKYRGDVYMITNPEKAIQDYTKAVELKPNYISAYYSRAIIYSCPFCNVPLSKEIEDYLTIINYNKNFCKAYQSLGELLSANKYYECADFMFTKAIELNPKIFKHYMQRGENYLALQKYEKAIKDFNTALEVHNKYHVGFNIKDWVYLSLGRTYNLLKNYNKAIDFYKYFEKDEKFSLTEYSNNSFSVYQEKPIDIVLEFDKSVANDVLNYHFHPTQKIKQLNNENVQVEFTSGGTYAICQELFKWGCSVKIQKPVELKNYYKKYLTDVLNNIK